jgi:hypothetical protein
MMRSIFPLGPITSIENGDVDEECQSPRYGMSVPARVPYALAVAPVVSATMLAFVSVESKEYSPSRDVIDEDRPSAGSAVAALASELVDVRT